MEGKLLNGFNEFFLTGEGVPDTWAAFEDGANKDSAQLDEGTAVTASENQLNSNPISFLVCSTSGLCVCSWLAAGHADSFQFIRSKLFIECCRGQKIALFYR